MKMGGGISQGSATEVTDFLVKLTSNFSSGTKSYGTLPLNCTLKIMQLCSYMTVMNMLIQYFFD